MKIYKLAAACAALAISAGAHATTITFDDLAEGSVVANQYAGLGVTFSGNGTILTFPNYNYAGYPPHSKLNVVDGINSSITATLSSAVSNVSFFYSSYYYGISLTAYDSFGNAIGSASSPSSYGYSSLLGISGAGISSVVINGFAGYYTIDDFSFGESESPAPEPASWALMVGGFGLIGGAMRNRHRTSVSFA